MKLSLAGPAAAFAAAVVLAACGGSSVPTRTADSATGETGSSNSKTFRYTGKEQKFIVPAGVTQLTVVAHGGEGGGLSMYPSTNTPGRPGRVYAIVPVHPGEKLYVFVAGSGTDGGFNGGGAGGSGGYGRFKITGNPGGGASDVRAGGDTLANRIIVAAGGGGAGEAIYNYGYASGGSGGGLVGLGGGSGGSYSGGGGGAGGSQSAGGAGGAGGLAYYPSERGQPGGNGALGPGGSGGDGHQGSYRDCCAAGGGGGGGGYYGGGGGGGSADAYHSYNKEQSGGGGGGSSYVEAKAIKSRMWTGWGKAKTDDGLIVFSWN